MQPKFDKFQWTKRFTFAFIGILLLVGSLLIFPDLAMAATTYSNGTILLTCPLGVDDIANVVEIVATLTAAGLATITGLAHLKPY